MSALEKYAKHLSSKSTFSLGQSRNLRRDRPWRPKVKIHGTKKHYGQCHGKINGAIPLSDFFSSYLVFLSVFWVCVLLHDMDIITNLFSAFLFRVHCKSDTPLPAEHPLSLFGKVSKSNHSPVFDSTDLVCISRWHQLVFPKDLRLENSTDLVWPSRWYQLVFPKDLCLECSSKILPATVQ